MPEQTNDLILRLEKQNEELLACQERNRMLMHRSLYGIIMIDNMDTIVYANPAAEQMLTCASDTLLGKEFPFQRIPGKVTETEMNTCDGRMLTIEAWGIDTEWDSSPAWMITLQNITERKRNEQELRKMYRAVLDSPVMVVVTDASGIIQYVNPKFSEVTGFSYGEAIGRNVCQEEAAVASPELFREIWESVSNGKEWHGELTSTRKNGESFHESVSIAPILDVHGLATNLVVVLEDITLRKQYEEQLRKSEQQLAEAQKIAHLGSWKCYLDTGKSYWSDELYRIFGLEPGEVTPSLEQFLALVHPDDRKDLRERARAAFTTLKPFSSHYCRIVRPDGSIRILLGQSEFVSDDTGSGTTMIGTALDVTERKELEDEIQKLNVALEARSAELEAANRELETFSYTVCHDLRSPLTNINGYCQVLTELCHDQLDEKCRGYLKEITRGTVRMNELIETLLRFSLITSETLSLVPANLSRVAREAVREFRHEHPDRDVEVRIQEEVVATADERLLRIVLHNLLGNAWKYTVNTEKAVIEFGAASIEGKITYFVRDNGIGFKKEDQQRLFTPFQRLPETEDIKGHGIGLATARRIVERHGGRIWAEGKPGKGATFYFTLSP